MRIIDEVIMNKNKEAASMKVLKRMADIIERNPGKYNVETSQLPTSWGIGKKDIFNQDGINTSINTTDLEKIRNYKPLKKDTRGYTQSNSTDKHSIQAYFPSTKEPEVYKEVRKNLNIYKKDTLEEEFIPSKSGVAVFDLGKVRPKNKVAPPTPHIMEDVHKKDGRVDDLYKQRRDGSINNVRDKYGIDNHPDYETVVKSDFLKDKQVGSFFNVEKKIVGNLDKPKMDKFNKSPDKLKTTYLINEIKDDAGNVNPLQDKNIMERISPRMGNLNNKVIYADQLTYNKKINYYNKTLAKAKSDALSKFPGLQEIPKLKYEDFSSIHNSGELPKNIEEHLRDDHVFKGYEDHNKLNRDLRQNNKSLWTSKIPTVSMHYTRGLDASKPIYFKANDNEKFGKVVNHLLEEPIPGSKLSISPKRLNIIDEAKRKEVAGNMDLQQHLPIDAGEKPKKNKIVNFLNTKFGFNIGGN